MLSTGGTAKLLREKGLKVRDVSDLTGFPEMLDGRVKTLHPKVHGGLLAIRSNPQHQAQVKEHGIEFIDMVVVNLYPFEKTAMKPGVTLEELIENIDIGGPSMLRSAAKNFEDVTVLVDAADYPGVLEELQRNSGSISRETRARLARKAFATTAAYDSAISTTLQKMANGEFPETLHLNYRKVMDLRYGENPHQKAALYRSPATAGRGLAAAPQLQGKELSYNNLVDLEAAWRLVQEFEEPDHGHHQTHQPLWSGHGRDAGGKLPARPGSRPGFGLRISDRLQPRGERTHGGRVVKAFCGSRRVTGF